MDEPSDSEQDMLQDPGQDSQQGWWRRRLDHLRRHTRSVVIFLGGMLAALAALVVYNLLNPAPAQLTLREVNDYGRRGHGFGHTSPCLLCAGLPGHPAGHRPGPGA